MRDEVETVGYNGLPVKSPPWSLLSYYSRQKSRCLCSLTTASRTTWTTGLRLGGRDAL